MKKTSLLPLATWIVAITSLFSSCKDESVSQVVRDRLVVSKDTSFKDTTISLNSQNISFVFNLKNTGSKENINVNLFNFTLYGTVPLANVKNLRFIINNGIKLDTIKQLMSQNSIQDNLLLYPGSTGSVKFTFDLSSDTSSLQKNLFVNLSANGTGPSGDTFISNSDSSRKVVVKP